MKSVFICGAHSTGKTTLIQHLEENRPKKLSKLPLLFSAEVAREVLRENNFDAETQQNKESFEKINTLILKKQYERENAIRRKCGELDTLEALCIFDRGVIDPISYLSMYVGQHGAEAVLKQTHVQEMIARLCDPTQSIVFVMEPKEKYFENDGIRIETTGFQVLLDYTEIMMSLLDLLRIGYHIITEEDLEKRAEFVENIIFKTWSECF